MRRSYAIVEKAPYLSSCGDPSWDAVMIEFWDSSDGFPFALVEPRNEVRLRRRSCRINFVQIAEYPIDIEIEI